MDFDRRFIVSGLVGIAIVAAVLIVAFGPGAAPAQTATPEGAFAAALDRIRSGDYDGVWGYLSERMRKTWSDEIDNHKRIASNAGRNKEMVESFTQVQYGFATEVFLSLTARELYAAYLKRNRDLVLGYEIVGPARVDGDRATLRIRARPDEPTVQWTYVREEDGRWLLDAAETVKQQ
ncbi:MAG: hypothetical protein MUE73_09155 [Planctomycetes bacterium]|nr:hypothetical protein [Planctomycetota bacterium]